MFDISSFVAAIDYLLFATCLFMVLGSVFLSYQTRFVQFRLLPELFSMLWFSLRDRKQEEGSHTILPYKALFTAMSTTIGIGTVVGPVIAIHWGGPGALVGFLLTSFFGSAATFIEVGLCIKYRQKSETGEIHGGPMQYLKAILSPAWAKWYAFICCMLMASWSGAQANQLGAILDSPLFGDYRVPTYISGIGIAALILLTLIGGIKRISAVSARIVPLMFVIYLGSSGWILAVNIDQLGGVMATIFESAFSPYAMATGSLVGGVVSAMRWGVFKGAQVTEAGLGTQTIPHSMAETNDPRGQAILAMVSTYSAGIIAFLSGCVALITGTWEDPELPLGISMVAASFYQYFSYAGLAIVAFITVLFAFGTILGNSYNGSQCFTYLADRKRIFYYYLGTACMIFFGTVAGVKTAWSIVDIGMACIAVPHMTALILHALNNAEEFHSPSQELVLEEA